MNLRKGKSELKPSAHPPGAYLIAWYKKPPKNHFAPLKKKEISFTMYLTFKSPKPFFTILNQSEEPKLGSSIHSNNLHAIIFRTFMILKISNFRTCICRRKKEKKMISIPYYIITRYQKLVHWAFLHQGKKELNFFLRWTQSLLWNFRCLKGL